MVNQSKFNFENIAFRKCCDVNHVWSTSCIYGSLILGLEAFRNAGLFFFGPIYLLQLWMNKHKITRQFLKQHFYAYLQSCIFGSCYAMWVLQAACLLRNLLGRYYLYTTVFIPAFISGLSIFLEHGNHRNIVIVTYFNLVLQFVTSWLQTHRGLKITPSIETALFMVLSGCLMYLLRRQVKNINTSILWFYTPLPLRKGDEKSTKKQPSEHNHVSSLSTNVCPHKGTCFKHILKCAGKFFGICLCVQLLRSILPLLYKRQIEMMTTTFRNKKIVLLGLFLGGYVGIYEGVSCLLNHYRGYDSDIHAALAGFLAGSIYYLEGNTIFILNAITTILQVLVMRGASKKMIPYPSLMGGLLFAFSNGILFHSMLTNHTITPKYFTSLLSLYCSGYSDIVQRTVLKIVYESPQ